MEFESLYAYARIQKSSFIFAETVSPKKSHNTGVHHLEKVRIKAFRIWPTMATSAPTLPSYILLMVDEYLLFCFDK